MPSRREFLRLVGAGTAASAGAGCAMGAGRTTSLSAVKGAAPSPGVLRLDSNENSYGPGPSALDAIRRALADANRYPFAAIDELTDAIAGGLGVRASEVVLGSGSTELLDAAVSAFTSRERSLLTAAPTFESTAHRASRIGSAAAQVAVDSQGRLDLDAMAAAAAGSGLVYVCNPNNPTGTVHGARDIEAVVAEIHRRAPETIVLLDEAYHDYVTTPAYRTAVPLATADPRLIVTRTFSKIHGMAGLRIGYAVGVPATLAAMRPWVADLTMSGVAASAARTSLGDRGHLDRQRALNTEARQATVAAFERAGYAVFPSEANFVMVDVRRDCRSFAAGCLARGVRVARAFPPLTTHARVTIGSVDEMRRAVGVFLDVLAAPPRPTPTAGVLPDDGRRAAC